MICERAGGAVFADDANEQIFARRWLWRHLEKIRTESDQMPNDFRQRLCRLNVELKVVAMTRPR